MSKSLGYGLDDSFISGTGSGMPQGITNSPALITVVKESGQAADTVCCENLTRMAGGHYSF